MKRWLFLLLAGAAASPSFAQDSGQGDASAPPPTPAPAQSCTPEHAAMGHCTMQPEAPPAPPPTCTAEHAAMGHCTLPAPTPTPAQSCTPEHAAMGHCSLPATAPGPEPVVSCTPEHAAMGHCSMPPEAPPAPSTNCTPEHAAMGHCSLPAQRPVPAPTPPPVAPPPATCTPEHAAMGHCTPGQPPESPTPDPHAGHGTATEPSAVLPPIAPPPPEALAGPPHAADLIFDPAAMAQARAALSETHGGLEASKFLIDQLELSIGEGREAYVWDAQFWYGGDIDKFWLKSEGEGDFGGDLDAVELQALWSRAIDPWFDLQAGVRQDFGSRPDRTHLVVGAQGLAPYWFEVEAAFFLSTKGDVTARFESEYDLRLTQRLILQPRLETDFSMQDIPELGLGSGLTSAEIGARLRYEIYPRLGPAVVAPYAGIQYERAFGDTADLRQAAGEDRGGWKFLLGLRTWF